MKAWYHFHNYPNITDAKYVEIHHILILNDKWKDLTENTMRSNEKTLREKQNKLRDHANKKMHSHAIYHKVILFF